MVLCRRRGCGAEYDPAANSACIYHPGTPIFHEGLKSWSCCNATNKPVLEFDQFIQIKGCATTDAHTLEQAPEPEKAPADVAGATDAVAAVSLKPEPEPAAAAPVPAAKPPAPAEAPAPEPRDPDSLRNVTPGMRCHRLGCKHEVDATAERDRAAEKCRFHPGAPIFHEGSKGYTCCKRRVLEFDEFIRIEPCTIAEHGHLYAPPPAPVKCRIDHYETANDVYVTVYARGVDEAQSTIDIREDAVVLSLQLANGRFERTLAPYAAVDAPRSSHTVGRAKLELALAKKEPGVSWPVLERGERVVGYGLTFGHR